MVPFLRRPSRGPSAGARAGPAGSGARRTASAGLVLASCAAALFAAVATTVLRTAGRDRWDVVVQRDLLAVDGRWASELARAAVDLAAPAVLASAALLAVLLLWGLARRPLLAAGVLAVPVTTAALVQLLAVAFAGVRPAIVTVRGVPVLDGSFPSAQTADAAALWEVLALAGLLLLRPGRGRLLCVGAGTVLGAAVAWGQLYRGRAWPTDVLAGWLLAGAAVGVAAALLATWPARLPETPSGTSTADFLDEARGRRRRTD